MLKPGLSMKAPGQLKWIRPERAKTRKVHINSSQGRPKFILVGLGFGDYVLLN